MISAIFTQMAISGMTLNYRAKLKILRKKRKRAKEKCFLSWVSKYE